MRPTQVREFSALKGSRSMTKRLEFFFDFRSPYSYLANTQLPGLGAEVAYRPFEILALMKEVGNVPTSIICKPKSKYLGADLPFDEEELKGYEGDRAKFCKAIIDAVVAPENGWLVSPDSP